MKKRMYKAKEHTAKTIRFFTSMFTCIPVILFWSISAYAALSINGVNGTVSHGQNIIISGTDFGTKLPVAPYFYDDFEGGTIGSSILGHAGLIGASVWQFYDSAFDNSTILYNASGYHGKSAYKASTGDTFDSAYIAGMNSLQVYTTFRMKFVAANPVNGVRKWFRLSSTPQNPYTGCPQLLMSESGGGGWNFAVQGYQDNNPSLYYCGPGSNSPSGCDNGISINMSSNNNVWRRLQGFLSLSNPAGTATGSFFMGGVPDANLRSVSNYITREAGAVHTLNNVMMPVEAANDGSNSYQYWVDDYYVDTTQARVEVCDSSTWHARTTCEIQIPNTTWNSSSIQIKVNQGTFADGSTAYLYVIDKNGQVSNGQRITFGVGSPAPDSPPSLTISTPTSAPTYVTTTGVVTIAGIASDDNGISSITWATNLGSSGTATNVSGNWSSWQIGNLALSQGNNIITVTAIDTAGQQLSKTITVTYSTTTPPPSASTAVWSASSQTGDMVWKNSGVTYSARLLIKGSEIMKSGNQFKLSFMGRSTGNYTIRKVSIAERDISGLEGDVVDATWTRVTFDGKSTGTWTSDAITVPAGQEKSSDTFSLPLQAGKDYYVTFKIDSPSVYLNPPSGYRELYFPTADHTEDIDWSGNGHSVTQDFHALSLINSCPSPVKNVTTTIISTD